MAQGGGGTNDSLTAKDGGKDPTKTQKRDDTGK